MRAGGYHAERKRKTNPAPSQFYPRREGNSEHVSELSPNGRRGGGPETRRQVGRLSGGRRPGRGKKPGGGNSRPRPPFAAKPQAAVTSCPPPSVPRAWTPR